MAPSAQDPAASDLSSPEHTAAGAPLPDDAAAQAAVIATPTVLPTACPLLGVLVEPQQRRAIAVQPIAAGSEILVLDGRESDTPTRYSVQLGPGLHLDPFDLLHPEEQVQWRPWMFLNHHCEPNAVLEGRTLRAVRDIPVGEGVTFDYNTTEWEMAEPFACHCGSPRCVGQVRGKKFAARP